MIDTAFAHELLEHAWPGRFARAGVRAFGAGWDNEAFLANDGPGGSGGGEWVVRFPRRALGGALMEHELAVLPALAAHLESWPAERRLALPVPELAHTASSCSIQAPRGYPWSFGAYRLLSGTTACRADLPPPAERAGAERLGAFLAALHMSPAPLRALAPQEPASRADRGARWAALGRRLAELTPETLAFVAAGAPATGAEEPLIPEAFLARAGELAQVPGRTAGHLVHGDLYGRHVLVDPASGAPSGLIDWGDVHVGDAAGDLALGWTFFAGAARARFLEAYAAACRALGSESGSAAPDPIAPDPIASDPHLVDRARFRAMDYAVLLLVFGQARGEAELLGLGRDAWWGCQVE